jgi:hypothetical protein
MPWVILPKSTVNTTNSGAKSQIFLIRADLPVLAMNIKNIVAKAIDTK